MSQPFAPGAQVGRYRLEAEVGRGGMGVVYRALDPALNRPVALKLLAAHLGHDSTALTRFHREAALVAGLKHPHLAIVYEFGEHEGQPYIAFEWIEGQTLKEMLHTSGPLPLERAAPLFDQLASALDYAHQRGVIHRDLKPANIIIGPHDRATIVDFGLAWLEDAPSITSTGLIMGTPRYIAPEQIEGKATDGRADLYSLAVVMYETLSGQPPFHHPNTPALFQQHLYAPPPPITEYNPSLPPTIDTVLTKALSKNPGERFPTATALTAALQTSVMLAGPHVALSPGLASPRRAISWQQGSVVMAILLGLGLLTALAWPNFTRLAPSSAAALSSATATNTLSPSPTASPPPSLTPAAIPTQTSTPDPAQEAPYSSPYWDGVWAMAGGNPTHANFPQEELPAFNPEPRWVHALDSENATAVVGGHGLLVYGTEGGIVRALDSATGELIWETRLGADLSGPPSLYFSDERAIVYVSTQDSELYALNFDDARLLWRIGSNTLSGAVVGGVVVGDDGALYAITDEGWLYVFGAENGDAYWSLDLSDKDSFSQPPLVNNVAIILAGENDLYAIDPASQEIDWSVETAGKITTPPITALGGSSVFIGTEQGQVQAFSILSGKDIWQVEVGSPLTGLSHDWTRLAATTAAGNIYAWYYWNGEQNWMFETGQEVAAGPVTTGEAILFGGDAVRILNAETGEEATDRTIALDTALPYAPVLMGSWLFVQTQSQIYAFGP